RRREDVGPVRKAADGAAALTRQLLAFSRQQVIAPRVVNLSAVVAGVEKMLRRVIGEDVDLVTVLDPGVGSVRADIGQLEQVLMNLAVRAVTREVLERQGYVVLEAPHGAAALDIAAQHRGPIQLLV